MTVFRAEINSVKPEKHFFVLGEGRAPFYVLWCVKTSFKTVLNGKEHILKPNQAVILKKGSPRTMLGIGQKLCLDFVQFSLEADSEQFIKDLGLPFDAPFDLMSTSSLTEIIARIAECQNKTGPYDALLIDTYMRWLLITAARLKIAGDDKRKINQYSEKLRILRAEIYREPQKKRSAAEEAKKLCISTSHFHHLYREAFGCTMMEEVISCRVEYAKEILCSRDISIEEAAGICGYTDVYHFIRQFKKTTGLPPGQYKKKYRQLYSIS